MRSHADASEVMAFHHTLESASLGTSRDIDDIAFGKDGIDTEFLSDLQFHAVEVPELTQEPQRFGAGLLKMAAQGFGNETLGFFIIPQLNGVVAVFFFGAKLCDLTGTGFDHGTGNSDTVVVIDTCHANLFS